MARHLLNLLVIPVFASAALLSASCEKRPDLVLYSAGDKIFTQNVIDAFKKDTGLNVEVASDSELTRGVALRTRIIKEKDRAQADVYWNNEIANTIILQKQGLLVPYKSPSASDIPDQWKEGQGHWTGFGARARIFLVNTKEVKKEDMPSSMHDMLNPKWKGKVGMSRITGGTTATHAAALFLLLGEKEAKEFYSKLKAAGVVLCDGNGHVKDQVVSGELAWGWTDTNDANVAIKQGKPVTVVYPDQGEGQIGTLLIPHSVGIVAGGPNPENARKFVDFLLRKETELMLAEGDPALIPVRPAGKSLDRPPFIMDAAKIKSFNSKIDFAAVSEKLPWVIDYMSANFNWD